MIFHVTVDEMKDLLKGNYTLLTCPECDLGTEYWDEDGNLISQKEYHRQIAKGELAQFGDCHDCHGLGKIIKFND